MAGRRFGFWTLGKLEILSEYLRAFTRACSRSDEIIYLDLFAGEPQNRDKVTGVAKDGSAYIALKTTPQFTRLRFFEIGRKARTLDEAVRRDFPDRNARVYEGDSNERIGDCLRELQAVRWAPTFAFIDPEGVDVKWTTLSALANFKPTHSTKVELWLLLPDGFMKRMLPLRSEPRPADADAITDFFGTDQWRAIYSARANDVLDSDEATDEYVNLMRWQLEKVLGYKKTHVLELVNEKNTVMYHMIFATDHEAGDRIMESLHRKAARILNELRAGALYEQQLAREREAGLLSLFETERDTPIFPEHYEHVPPWEPFRGPY